MGLIDLYLYDWADFYTIPTNRQEPEFVRVPLTLNPPVLFSVFVPFHLASEKTWLESRDVYV
jgi:hypothetical protein